MVNFRSAGTITTNNNPGSSNAQQYTGRENDGDGLYYYRARYYSPGLQRFISQDSLGLLGGMDPYAYADGDPINQNDPSGNCPWCVGALVGAGIDLGIQLIQNGGKFSCVNWAQVGISAVTSAGLGIVGRYAVKGLLAKTFINSNYRSFASAYWGMNGGAFNQWYGAGNLDHWLISNAAIKAGEAPAWLGNAGWNLLEIPAMLNQAMGMRGWMSPAAQAATRIAVSASVPGAAALGGWGGFKLGQSSQESQCECSK